MQKANSSDGDNKRFKAKIALLHSYFTFCIFQFTLCILHLIARNPQDFEQLLGCGGLEKIVGELKAGKFYFFKNRKFAKS